MFERTCGASAERKEKSTHSRSSRRSMASRAARTPAAPEDDGYEYEYTYEEGGSESSGVRREAWELVDELNAVLKDF